MNFKYILFTFLFITVNSFSQKKEKVLFTVADEPISTSEFVNVYKKNLSLINNDDNSVENYLNLYINYKLKVKQAKELKLDTLSEYKKELNQYKESLTLPYLKDESVTNKLVKEAYERMLKEVNASHILIFAKKDDLPADTLVAFNKLIEARKKILDGAKFEDIANEYSQDPSVKQNGGDIGYFSVMQMVYPFENVAYNTKIGEVSEPFRTKFGFHILKINNIRDAQGEVEVAHIMLKAPTEKNKTKIDSIYNLLTVEKQDFSMLAKKVSQDASSAIKGGKMQKFSYGRMLESFAKQAFALKTEEEISKPFQTKFGWHIIKLLKKYPIGSFENTEAELKQKIEKDNRSNLIGKSVIDSLYRNYKIVVDLEGIKQFDNENWKESADNFTSKLLTIQDKEISQKDFITHLKKAKNLKVSEAFEKFKETEVLTYYKENLQFTNPTFAATLKEFSEGLMLFELLEQRVWDKSKDSIGLNNFYNSLKAEKYNNKELKDIRGKVISDYQNQLEKDWIQELHNTYKVEVNRKEKKKVLKQKF